MIVLGSVIARVSNMERGSVIALASALTLGVTSALTVGVTVIVGSTPKMLPTPILESTTGMGVILVGALMLGLLAPTKASLVAIVAISPEITPNGSGAGSSALTEGRNVVTATPSPNLLGGGGAGPLVTLGLSIILKTLEGGLAGTLGPLARGNPNSGASPGLNLLASPTASDTNKPLSLVGGLVISKRPPLPTLTSLKGLKTSTPNVTSLPLTPSMTAALLKVGGFSAIFSVNMSAKNRSLAIRLGVIVSTPILAGCLVVTPSSTRDETTSNLPLATGLLAPISLVINTPPPLNPVGVSPTTGIVLVINLLGPTSFTVPNSPI